jgi:hypothetical protein
MTSLGFWRLSIGLAVRLLAGLGPACLAQGAGAAGDHTIVVKLDFAKVVKLPAKAQTIILGNPIVADVTVVRGSDMMIITGKGYGISNLVILDRGGNVVGNEVIRVEQEGAPLVIVQRGMDRESYSCFPRCQPTIELGDSAGYAKGWADAIQARNSLAVGQVPNAPGGASSSSAGSAR